MVQKINLLLEQKHLFNEIDLFIYSTFLQENEIDELLKIYNLKETNLENLLNSQQKKKRKSIKKALSTT